jgi:hypothetical protein
MFNRSQASAIVHSKGPFAVPLAIALRGASFWGFDILLCDGHVLFHVLTSVMNVESRFVTGAILWKGFQKMSCIFRGRLSTLEASVSIFPGKRSTLDVWSRVLLTPCKFRSRPGTWWDRRFSWQAQYLVKFRRLWNVTFCGRRCILDTCVFALDGFRIDTAARGAMLCGSRNIWYLVTLRGQWRELLPTNADFTFPIAHLPPQKLYISHSARHPPFKTSHFTRYTENSALETPHFTLHALHHTTLLTTHFRLLDFTLHTPHLTVYTLHCAPYNPQSTRAIHNLHFTLCTTFYTSHSTLQNLHSTLHSLHSTLHSTLHTRHHSTLYTADLTLHTPHSTLRTLHFTLRTLHSALYTSFSTFYTSHSTLCTARFTPHSTLNIGE